MAVAGASSFQFTLLQPGPRPRDALLASEDVLQASCGIQLQRVHDHAVSMAPGNYIPAVPGDAQPYRGPGMDLTPLADVYPSANRPSTAPLSADTLVAAFTLEPGASSLPEADKGEMVSSAWAGTAAVRPVVPVKAGTTSITIKLKKEKKDKEKKKKDKDKKRKHAAAASQ